MKEQTGSNRDFSSITPSAKWILLMKGHTTIPYAKEAAEIVEGPQGFHPDFDNRDASFWGRSLHFESRYHSIDSLLNDLPAKNILELSSGFSFRGLDLVQRKDVCCIDTDLPDMITQKQKLLDVLQTGNHSTKGTLQLMPLNALYEAAFNDVCNHFPPGPIAVINEGLLMYLNTEEKEKLCGIIRSVLENRGGYWITADIYLKLKPRGIELPVEAEMQQFFEDHQVDENRFDSFEAAEEFFVNQGFIIDKEAAVNHAALSTLPHLLKTLPPDVLQSGATMEKIQTTWRLQLAND